MSIDRCQLMDEAAWWFVVGARPNFVKAAPVLREAKKRDIPTTLVHTGQHYDQALSGSFFDELGLPEPDVYLGVGSGTHANQTAAVMTALEPRLVESRARCVVVFGDVNSTLAAALTAAKLSISVAHVEAGLRSFDRSMPEELNRILTDHLSETLFTTEQSGNENLAREGIAQDQVHFVGNTMIDTLRDAIDEARVRAPSALKHLGVEPGKYAILTLHRPSTVDDPVRLSALLAALATIGRDTPVVFPVHPRTARMLRDVPSTLHMLPPLGYMEFLGLMDSSALVLTDSGGIQEETTALGVPCLTLRNTTERPVTTMLGTNRVVGVDPDAVRAAATEVLLSPPERPRTLPPLWDGHAALRVMDVLEQQFGS